jgi:hypothetical protein
LWYWTGWGSSTSLSTDSFCLTIPSSGHFCPAIYCK